MSTCRSEIGTFRGSRQATSRRIELEGGEDEAGAGRHWVNCIDFARRWQQNDYLRPITQSDG